MTILHVYNLYDATCETYVAQYFNSHDKLMRRDCENLYENAKLVHQKNPLAPQGALYRYSDSYMMIHTADFDDQTGIYTSLDVPVTICNFGIFNSKVDDHSSQTLDEKVYTSYINNPTDTNVITKLV